MSQALPERKARYTTALSHATAAVDAASSYTTIGTIPAEQLRIISFVNTSDVDILVSFDGTNAHRRIPAGMVRDINYALVSMYHDGKNDATIKFKKASGTATVGVFEIEFLRG